MWQDPLIRYVVRMVAFVSSKSKSEKETTATLVPAQRLSLFGPPPLIAGEDGAAYDQLLARFCAVVKPVDIIDEMLIAEVVSLEWEILRWRRLKWDLVQARALKALERFLVEIYEYDYDLYCEDFAQYLTEILRDDLTEDQADSAQTLAHRCARDEADAVDEVEKILEDFGLSIDQVRRDARTKKAKELVQKYVRREPDAVTLVNELLTGADLSMDSLMTNALAKKLDKIERIDRLATIAESRRHASLREIDRRRAVLGERLRQSVQEIEDAEYKVIETPPAKGKNAT